jgi:tRNA threonylcarbamoyladenosine biosynthesis protein TsaE
MALQDQRCPVVVTHSAEETELIGAGLAANLHPGEIVLLEGELGAGKTTLVRGACRALGVSATVSSPTFTIAQRYAAAVPVAHVDLYRIASLADEQPELLADYITPDSITFVEWPGESREQLAALGSIAAVVSIEHAGQDRRTISISVP